MNALVEFFKSRNMTSHSVTAACILIASLTTTDTAFRDMILKLFQAHPKLGTDIVTLSGILTMYLNAKKKKQ